MTHSSDKTPSSLVATHPRKCQDRCAIIGYYQHRRTLYMHSNPNKKKLSSIAGILSSKCHSSNHVCSHILILIICLPLCSMYRQENMLFKKYLLLCGRATQKNFESMMNAWKMGFCALSCSVTGMEPQS